MSLLKAHADAGDLDALRELAWGYDHGYLRVSPTPENDGMSYLLIRTWPWDAPVSARRYERALNHAARAGDETALFYVADRLLLPHVRGADDPPSSADKDSADAIYRRLVAADADPFRLALLAQHRDDDEGYRQHLAVAADAGNPTACVFRTYMDRRAQSDAAGIASQIDAMEACRDRATESPYDASLLTYADRTIRGLADQVRQGNGAAVALMDSLRAEGVFERHPRLAALADA